MSTVELIGRPIDPTGQPDLQGNLMPVRRELDLTRCEVEGTLPAGLRGTFIRNGPNPAFPPIGRYHMFDGDGMLHAVTIDEDGAGYRNRWVRSRGLVAETRHGSTIYPGLGDVLNFPDRSLTGDAGPVKNPANTHIIEHAGRLLALWEGGLPTEVTLDLDTIGEHDFDGALRGSMTAHPRLDPVTGEMHFFAYSLFEPYLRYHVADADGTLVHSVDLDLPAPVMMHDMILTEQYAVFLDSPITFNVDDIGTGPMVTWRPERGTRLGVLPRMGQPDEMRWFPIENGHVQHFWNGWEEGDTITLTGSRFDAPDFGIESDGSERQMNVGVEPGRPARFTIDLARGEAAWEPTDSMGGDFCRINDAFNGVRNRYDYMSGFVKRPDAAGDFDAIVKYDNVAGTRHVWHAGPHGHVGESVFAADPAGRDEDDGWLLNLVYFSDTETTALCVLDATDVEAGPVATIRTPQRVPFGFHANWFPA